MLQTPSTQIPCSFSSSANSRTSRDGPLPNYVALTSPASTPHVDSSEQRNREIFGDMNFGQIGTTVCTSQAILPYAFPGRWPSQLSIGSPARYEVQTAASAASMPTDALAGLETNGERKSLKRKRSHARSSPDIVESFRCSQSAIDRANVILSQTDDGCDPVTYDIHSSPPTIVELPQNPGTLIDEVEASFIQPKVEDIPDDVICLGNKRLSSDWRVARYGGTTKETSILIDSDSESCDQIADISCALLQHGLDYKSVRHSGTNPGLDLLIEDNILSEHHSFVDHDPFYDVDEEVAPNTISIHTFAPTAQVFEQTCIEDVETKRMLHVHHESRFLRPWLSSVTRKFLLYTDPLDMTKETILHVDFSASELTAIKSKIDTPSFHELHILRKEQLINSILPGRAVQAVLKFVEELHQQPFDSSKQNRMVIQAVPARSIHQRLLPSMPQMLRTRGLIGRRRKSEAMESWLCERLKPHQFFDRASGDINDIAFDPWSDAFAIGSIATNDEYNRSGNLILQLASNTVRVLEHKNLATSRYPSISCVRFAREGKVLLAGGTDGTLKFWSRDGRLQQDRSSGSRKSVNDIATSQKFPHLAFTSHGSGHLDLYIIDAEGNPQLREISHHPTLAPAISCFNDLHNSVITGYESRPDQPHAGQVSVIDIQKTLPLLILNGFQSYAHLAVTDEGLWVAGTNSAYDGTVSLHDHRHPTYTATMMRTPQMDINEVSMHANYITSAATNSTCYVWDVRKSDEPIHILKHGTSKLPLGSEDITGITGTRFFTDSRFISAGSDGVVKLWDLNRSQEDVFIKDFATVDSPITRIALSPTKDRLIIGENKGTAHVYSYLGGDRPAELLQEIS